MIHHTRTITALLDNHSLVLSGFISELALSQGLDSWEFDGEIVQYRTRWQLLPVSEVAHRLIHWVETDEIYEQMASDILRELHWALHSNKQYTDSSDINWTATSAS